MLYKYPHPELFEGWERPDYQQYCGNIILYGAGKIGGVAAYCLKKLGIDFIAFCDSSEEKQGLNFYGHKVISPIELKEKYKSAAIIVTTTFHAELSKQLKNDGFTNVLDCVSLFIKIDFTDYDFSITREYAERCVEFYLSSILFKTANSLLLKSVTVFITTKCNLRCRECSSFVPYIESPKHYDVKKLNEDLNGVLGVFGTLERVTLLGGETLLHPELPLLLRELNRNRSIELICLITNATILPKEEALKEMQNPKFIMRISDYGKLSTKLDRLIELLESRNIRYELTNYTYWNENSKIQRYNDTDIELRYKFSKCVASLSFYMMDGKLYYCNNAAILCELGALPDSPDNYVDLRENNNISKLNGKIINFYERMRNGDYTDACRYCNGLYCTQFNKEIPVAEQTTQLLKFPKLY